jgi:hypothetical protein
VTIEKEKGSDERLAEVADERQVEAGVRNEQEKSAAEEERVQAESPADDEPE